jgi:hypothetical protein
VDNRTEMRMLPVLRERGVVRTEYEFRQTSDHGTATSRGQQAELVLS